MQDPKMITHHINDLSDNDINYLEIPALQEIIKYKWRVYAKDYFLKQAALYCVYLVFMLNDFIFAPSFAGKTFSKACCVTIIAYFARSELRQLRNQEDYAE